MDISIGTHVIGIQVAFQAMKIDHLIPGKIIEKMST